MRSLWPTAAETATLRFLLPVGALSTRALLAASCFLVGLGLWLAGPWWIAPFGLALVLAGHLPLWVRTQTTAPGGATPAHEEVWAPVEDDWLTRVETLERQGARWDTTPWDLSNALGCLTLFALLGAIGAAAFLAVPILGAGSALRLMIAGGVLLLPLWINGMRTTWNPSELRKKGRALALAREDAERLARGDFDVVPTLALREGRRGKYPVDARLMLRPSREDGTGFLGVQVQVALNNVRGTDYPYLYAVVLGKGDFQLPTPAPRMKIDNVDLVFEPGADQGVRFLVVRQHADKNGGWHTEPHQISTIVAVALERARKAWKEQSTQLPKTAPPQGRSASEPPPRDGGRR